MEFFTGKLISIFIFAVLLASLGAWLTAYRYRKVMRRLMSAPSAQAAGAAVPTSEGAPPWWR